MEDRYLFKAKRIDWREFPEKEQWIIGYYVLGFDVYEQPVHLIFEPTSMFFSHGETDGWTEVDPTTICQCSGREDKNGNFIWENDIVRGKMHGNYGYRKLVGVVQYYIDAFKVNVEQNSFSGVYKNISDTCEVIGNIFDNPELLESEE